MATGYSTPQEGQAARTGNHTVWLLFPDGKWYSPKEVSGLPPEIETKRHVKALEGKFVKRQVLRRTRRRSVI